MLAVESVWAAGTDLLFFSLLPSYSPTVSAVYKVVTASVRVQVYLSL